MDYNQEKVDEMALGLLYLTMHKDKISTRAWKNLDFEVIPYAGDPGHARR